MPVAATPVPWLDVETMIKAGVGSRETARRLGLSEERVKRMATRKGWAAQAPAARLATAQANLDTIRAEVVPDVPTAADALAATLAEDDRMSRLHLSRGLRKAAEHVGSLEGQDTLEKAEKVKALTGSLAQVHRWQSEVAVGVQVNIGRGLVE